MLYEEFVKSTNSLETEQIICHWHNSHLSGPRLRQHAVRAHLRVDGGPLPLPRHRQGLQGRQRVGLGPHEGPAEDTAQPEGAGKASKDRLRDPML